MADLDSRVEASDSDLADQAAVIDDPADETESSDQGISANTEADAADVLEQRQSVPSGDDGYDR